MNPVKPVVKRKGQFPKGNIPWNKGIYYQPKNLPKRWSMTNPAPQWAKEGDIRVHHEKGVPYRVIKLNGKWCYYHRYIWEQHYGAIPKGYIVRFINGNTMDDALENLECISRADNIRRNHNRKKASCTLTTTWKREKVRANLGLTPITKFGRRYQ